MSKTRTGHGPNDWRDDGPQTAQARVNHYAVGALTGSAMVPMAFTGQPVTSAETARRERKRQKRHDATAARELNPRPKPVCGAAMKLVGDTCARRPGHRDCHLSRFAMDNDRDARRSRGTAA